MLTGCRRTLYYLAAIAVCLGLCAGSLYAQAEMKMIQIAKDVYTMANPTGSSNSTFIVTPEGVVVFDSHITTANQTMAAIRKVTDKKVVYLFSSHPSGDHATGAWHFR